jgi:lipoprotein-releasing system permease protein
MLKNCLKKPINLYRRLIFENPSLQEAIGMRLVAIIFSVLLIAAGFLPWWQSDVLPPFIWGCMILIGTFNLIQSIYYIIKKRKGFAGLLLTGIIGLALIAWYVYSSFAAQFEYVSFTDWFSSQAGTGLYTAIVSMLGLVVCGWMIGRLSFEVRDFVSEAYASKHQAEAARFMANRIAFNQQRSFSRFIIRISIVATVISVAVMIMTLALANGFQAAVSQKVFSFWGHVRIQEKQPEKSVLTEEIPIIRNDTLVAQIKHNPEVTAIHPFATKYAILKTKDEIEGVLVKGLDSTYDFNYFKPFMQEGRFIQFNDSSYSREIIISTITANLLELKVNDRPLIYFVRPDGSLRADRLSICGIYKTGIEEYDKSFAVGDIKLIQRLNQWDADEVGGYEIFLDNSKNMDAAVEDIYAMDEFPEVWDTKSVKQIAPNIFDWLSMQDVTRNVLIGIMVIVAIINLITCLLILVLERVQMIGVLKSLGASNWTVQRIFLRHSLIITLTGIVIGTFLAIAILYLQKETGFIKLKEEAYYLSEAAVKIVWWQVGIVCLGTLIISFLVLMIPSILARKVQPLKAIHFR